jgi:hypothetical protein
LTQWQGLLTRHVAQTRQILRKLLVGRLRFTFDAESQTCEFTGQGAFDPILSGILGPKALVSPTGMEGFCRGPNGSWAMPFHGVVNAA